MFLGGGKNNIRIVPFSLMEIQVVITGKCYYLMNSCILLRSLIFLAHTFFMWIDFNYWIIPCLNCYSNSYILFFWSCIVFFWYYIIFFFRGYIIFFFWCYIIFFFRGYIIFFLWDYIIFFFRGYIICIGGYLNCCNIVVFWESGGVWD